MFRIFLAQQRSAPGPRDRHGDPAALARRARAGQRRRPAGPRRARPARARHAAALPGGRRPGPQRAVPLVRPAAWSTPSGPTCWPACAARSSRSPPTRTPPTGPSGWTRWPRSPSASSASSADRLEDGVPEREPLLEVLIRRHYREYELQDLRSLQVDGRPFAVADYVLDGRPTPSRLDARHVRRARRRRAGWPRALADQVADRAARTSRRVVDLYLSLAGRAGRRRRVRRARLVAALRPMPFARDVRRVARRRLLRRRPAGRVLHLPAGRRRAGRGRPGARPAPDGRAAAGPVAAARLRHHPHRRARGRPASTTAWPRTTPPTSDSSRWPRCASSRCVRDDDDRVSSLPQVERAIANCVEGIRRGPRAAAAAAACRWT